MAARKKVVKKVDKVVSSEYYDTIEFDETKVGDLSQDAKDFHIVFCEDELAIVKDHIKLGKKSGNTEDGKSLRGWRQRMYNRLRLLQA